jgi:hypothetical protein
MALDAGLSNTRQIASRMVYHIATLLKAFFEGELSIEGKYGQQNIVEPSLPQ